jgi:cysteinyl-tRNA synthetase
MNLTDVDDKTIRDSQKEHLKLKEFISKYEKAFFEDIKTLNIKPAFVYPKATEHIREMVELIKKLISKGYAYKSEDGSIYYKISKFKKYGKLANIKVKEQKIGARVNQDEYEKDNAQDFALWKAWTNEDGDVYWNTELGKGRPGWHIECSAMAGKYLGNHFDIHCGGIDNMFPHHENEIAQTEAATGKKFVNYWLHCEHLLVDGKKMSKSLGNFYTLRDLLDKGYSARAIRWTLLKSHYRQSLNFSLKELESSEIIVKKIDEFMLNLKNYSSSGRKNINVDSCLKRFEKEMDKDLNIAGALGSVFELMKETNILLNENKLNKESIKKIIETMKKFDIVLGILKEYEDIPSEIKKLADQRLEARKNKDWKESDRFRDLIKDKGYSIDDTKEGYIIRKL